MNIEDYKDEFIRYWNLEYTYKEMATVLPFNASQIYAYSRVLKSNGEITARPTRKKRSFRRMVVERYKKGERDFDKIAKEFNISKSAVYKYLWEAKFDLKHIPSVQSIEIAKAIIALPKEQKQRGFYSELAKQFNTTRQNIWLVANNLDRYKKYI